MLTLQSLKLAWAFLKKYAWILFAVVAGVLGILLLKRAPSDMAEQIDAINKRHEEEIKRIQDADAQHARDLEENQRRLEETLKQLDQRYRDAIAHLDDQKRAEVDRILREHGDDPDALAQELSDTLGFQVKKSV